jgi:large subunit ribosomal protein L10
MYNAADVEIMSQLPSKDVMRAQFLGLLEAPMAQTLAVMEALISSVVYCLDNKIELDGQGKESDTQQEQEQGQETDKPQESDKELN